MHVRTWSILRSRSLDDAAAVVTGEPRACAGNLLLAQAPDRALALEAAPAAFAEFPCGSGCFVHTNHFTDPDALGVVEPPSERRPHSYNRRNRMQALLASKRGISASDIKAWVTDHDDHPFGICRHEDWNEPPSEHYVTVTSVLMDLYDRTMSLTDGQPCRSEWQDLAL
jgi:isopenicillin-N N-acyltransferase-like protein